MCASSLMAVCEMGSLLMGRNNRKLRTDDMRRPQNINIPCSKKEKSWHGVIAGGGGMTFAIHIIKEHHQWF